MAFDAFFLSAVLNEIRALDNLRENWVRSIGIAAFAFLLGGLMNGISFIPTIDSSTEIGFLQDLNFLLEEGIQIGNWSFGLRHGLLGLVGFLLGGTIQLGYANFLLKQHDGQDPRVQDLFSQFDNFGTGFVQVFLRSLYTVLWSCLFVIPGIVKSLHAAIITIPVSIYFCQIYILLCPG